MFLGITACLFMFVVTGTGATDIAPSDCSVVSSEVLFVICQDLSYSDNTFILSVLLELVLVLLYGLHHMYFIYRSAVTSPNFVCGLTTIHFSCKVSLLTLYQML